MFRGNWPLLSALAMLALVTGASQSAWALGMPSNAPGVHAIYPKFLSCLKAGAMPAWEVPNMLAKYFTTTRALELARAA